jgi:hypothetical protein
MRKTNTAIIEATKPPNPEEEYFVKTNYSIRIKYVPTDTTVA